MQPGDPDLQSIIEEALLASETRYRDLFDGIPVGLYRTAPDGRILDANLALVKELGYPDRESLLKVNVAEIYVQADVRFQEWEILARDGVVRGFEMQLRRRDGSIIWVEDTFRAVYDKNGRVAYHEGCLQNITERKRAEAAEREQRSLAEALVDIAAVLNSTLQLDNVLQHVLDNLGRVVPHDMADIMIVDGRVARVVRERVDSRFNDAVAIRGSRFQIEEMVLLREMAATGRPHAVPDTAAFPGWIQIEGLEWVRSFAGAPVLFDGQCIGFLNLGSATPNFYDVEQAQLLQAFANQAATALHNAHLYQALERYSGKLEEAVQVRTAELQQTKEQLEAILDNSSDAILLAETNGAIKIANQAVRELLGYRVNEIVGQAAVQLIAPEQAGLFQFAFWATAGEGQRKRVEILARHKDGTEFDADVALAPVWEEEEVVGVVCSLRDISALKEVERMKDAFVSNVSHELRTPITSLQLSHGLLSLRPEKKEVYLEGMARELERLNLIVEDLLRLSRLDQGQINMALEVIDLNHLAGQYIRDRQPLAEAHALKLTARLAPGLAPVQADPGLLGQALSILLTNALNYTPSGGQVVVQTCRQQTEGQEWSGLTVRDSGPGIPLAEQPHLFERFYRGQAGRESGAAGTGLGLSIAEEIVHHHHGRLEVSSEGVAGKGSTFSIWLPVRA